MRWFHTGGIFAGLSDSTAQLAIEGVRTAGRAGTIVSYDVNHRRSLWQSPGRDPVEVNRLLLPHVDVLFGSIEDYRTGLGFDVEECPVEAWVEEPDRFASLVRVIRDEFPGIQAVAMSLRHSRTAGFNHWDSKVSPPGRNGLYQRRPSGPSLDWTQATRSNSLGFLKNLLGGDGPEARSEQGWH